MTLTTERLKQLADPNRVRKCSMVEYQSMARELLANREAQPVFFIEIEGDDWVNAGRIEGENRPDLGLLPDGINYLYTAPPAPAVPGNLAAAVNRLLDCDGTRGHFSAIRCSDAREEVERLLAQPVSSGYKLVPVEPTESMIIDGFESDAFMALADAVNEKNSWPYGCRESAECVEGIFKAMLAAAPTQGKDNE